MTTTTHPILINSEGEAHQFEPTSVTQGIASLNVFADLLMYLAIESNKGINNDECNSRFIHVSESDGGLVLSFTTMRVLFLMRDMFWEQVEKVALLGTPGMDFDGMQVIAYPSNRGPGLVTWGTAAAVSRLIDDGNRH